MSSKGLSEEEKKKLENEFSEFLIQRIKHAGGSLQFHHLSGLLQQAKFEIRNAFGTTKSELMKFLRSHPKIFQIDSVGIVSITSSVSSDDSDDSDTCGNTEKKENSPENIKNGLGTVIKLNAEYGIIEAYDPIQTEVHFKSEALNGNKNILLTDSGLKIEHKVGFVAVYGDDDYEIKYRATKVWPIYDRNMTSDDVRENERASNTLHGEGIIQNIFSNLGCILVYGKEEKTVFFSKHTVRDCNDNELTKFFNVGDPVEFFAYRKDIKGSEAQWQATYVKKKTKDNVQSSSQSSIETSIRNGIENEPGKICPHSHGAIIKFGKDYSKLADGDSSSYFLYGAEVSDIAWEFSEGDDVLFDAVKTKSAPGWKAVLVWVGEKPTYAKNKMFIGEQMKELPDESCPPTESLRTKTVKSDNGSSVPKQETQSKSKEVFDHSVSSKVSHREIELKKQNLKLSKSFQSYSAKESKEYWKGGIKREKENTSVSKKTGNQHRAAKERKVMCKSNHKNTTINETTASRYQTDTELNEAASHFDGDCDDHLSYEEDVSHISRGYFQDEFQLHNDKIFLKEESDNIGSSSEYNFVDCDENDNTRNEMKCYKSGDKKRSSIKKFEDVDGEVINLYCKAAIVKSSELHKTVDFVLNVFYINGKSVEEQQVIDLKEIIKVGDHVNFNCFEIIDNMGEIHQKVTMAWKGPKPKVYEMTPEEFIDVYQLSVTLSDELFFECSPDQRTASQDSFAEVLNSKTTAVTEYGVNSSSEDVSDADTFLQLKTSETQLKEKLHEKDLLFNDHHKQLSDVIIHRLKSKGFISADLEVDFSGVLNQIVRLARKHSSFIQCESPVNKKVEKNSKKVSEPVCLTCSEKKRLISAGKNKSEKHAAVQTIITGAIVAQSIYTQN